MLNCLGTQLTSTFSIGTGTPGPPIPFDTVQQVCLTPLAYTKGTDFKPAPRPPVDTIVHWDTW